MKKNVLIISTSPRPNGNSDTLANECLRGARDQGHNVKKIHLYNKQFFCCKGCLKCQTMKMCILQDDMNNILDEIKKTEVIVFATPIYFYEMCGQMKMLLDRTNVLIDTKYKFRDIYLLASAADEEKDTFDGAIRGLQGWVRCFKKTTLRGIVKGFNLNEMGDAQKDMNILKEAYAVGASIG